jgi:hypothetical protein
MIFDHCFPSMKKIFLAAAILISLSSSSQTVFGYWYGSANVDVKTAASNYLVELVLQPEKGSVKGILNYYFKNIYRSLRVEGKYNKVTRKLILHDIPMTFYGSKTSFEIDCIMDLHAILRVAKTGSTLTGQFIAMPDYKYTCAEINFKLTLDAGGSKKDSVLRAIRQFKETYQLWELPAENKVAAAPKGSFKQKKVVDTVVENQFKERENVVSDEIEVESDSIKVDFYDNGVVDGDSISVFFNKQLIAISKRLTTKSVHFNILLDSLQDVNELSMFADNLGSIPPNTALMVIDDGKNKFNIRISSNLEKNATVKIKRKKKTIKAK